ncbi:hypothetical protein [Jiella mangrovi]|uniref:hypothetical protein n=1 Tax=Jiella mangrovi TaxID=2821407 RepID=UPI003CC9135E
MWRIGFLAGEIANLPPVDPLVGQAFQLTGGFPSGIRIVERRLASWIEGSRLGHHLLPTGYIARPAWGVNRGSKTGEGLGLARLFAEIALFRHDHERPSDPRDLGDRIVARRSDDDIGRCQTVSDVRHPTQFLQIGEVRLVARLQRRPEHQPFGLRQGSCSDGQRCVGRARATASRQNDDDLVVLAELRGRARVLARLHRVARRAQSAARTSWL